MRKLYEVTAPILPSRLRRPVSFERRRVCAVNSTLTCLVLVKHDDNGTQFLVSDDGDAVGAVWINKQPLLVDPKDRGQFLVVTLTRTLAQQKGLYPSILPWERYLPEERAMAEDAVKLAQRTRFRLSGQSNNRPTWHGGRNVYA